MAGSVDAAAMVVLGSMLSGLELMRERIAAVLAAMRRGSSYRVALIVLVAIVTPVAIVLASRITDPGPSASTEVDPTVEPSYASPPSATPTPQPRGPRQAPSAWQLETRSSPELAARFRLAELYTDDELLYFREVAFGADQDVLDIFSTSPEVDRNPNTLQDRTVKWTQDIVYFTVGDATQEDIDTVLAVASELSYLMLEIDFVRRQSREDAQVAVYFIEPTRFEESYGGIWKREYLTESGGFSSTWAVSPDYSIERSLILIDSTAPNDRRRQAIRRELTRVIGLLDTSWWYPDSVFYEGDSSTTRFADIDWAVIRLLYDPRIKPGMTYSDMLGLFR